MPPFTYLTNWCMAIARRLQHETDLKLVDVAGRIGYESEFAFSKAFKHIYGISPGVARLLPVG